MSVMIGVDAEQVEYMRDAVFFDGPDAPRRLSRFWILLTLAAIIAGTGVIADSTATVIGAMIVAPLMIPIQGTMLATVLGERANLIRSLGLVVTAAIAAIAIGFGLALLTPNDVVAATNSQVAARVSIQGSSISWGRSPRVPLDRSRSFGVTSPTRFLEWQSLSPSFHHCRSWASPWRQVSSGSPGVLSCCSSRTSPRSWRLDRS